MNSRKIIIYLSVLAVIATAAGLILWQHSSMPVDQTIPTQEIFRSISDQETSVPEEPNEVPDKTKFQLPDVVEAYKENIRYPKYSKPLNKNDWDLLHPRAFIPRVTPLAVNPRISAGIILDQYIVSRDQDLPVKVIIQGQDGYFYSTAVNLSLSDKENSRSLLRLYEYDSSGGVSTYTGTVPAAMLSDVESGEVALNAEILFANNEHANVTAVVKLFGNEATLTHLGKSYVDGANLIIPAYFDVKHPGNYRVQANIFDESGEEPVSHLNIVFPLTSQNNSGLLKVHASTLRSKDNPGPYLLKDFNITKNPARPGDKTGYGSSKSNSFTVQGFPLNNYSHEEYEDPKNKQRLEFLKKIAGDQ